MGERASSVIRVLWPTLSSEARALRSLASDEGRLSSIGRKMLGPRVFGLSPAELERDIEIDPRSVHERFEIARPTLEALPGWHGALLRAHSEWIAAGLVPLSADPIRYLVKYAYELAEDLPDADEGERVRLSRARISDLAGVRTLTEPSLAAAVEDPVILAELQRRLDTLWLRRQAANKLPDQVEVKSTFNALLEQFDTVPNGTVALEGAEPIWQRVKAQLQGFVLDAESDVALSSVNASQPALRREGGSVDEAEAFLPLDRSLEERFHRVLAGEGRNESYAVASRAAWDRAVDVSVLPYGLASADACAVLDLAAHATQAMTFEGSAAAVAAAQLDAHLPNGVRILAVKWRGIRLLHKLAKLGLIPEGLATHARDPQPYLLGRLWVRLYRLAFLPPSELDAASAWAHIHGAFTSTRKNVPTVFSRAVRRELQGGEVLGRSGRTDPNPAVALESLETEAVTGTILASVASRRGVDRVAALVVRAYELGARRLDGDYVELRHIWDEWLAEFITVERPFKMGRRGQGVIYLMEDDLPGFGQALPFIQSRYENGART